MAILCDAHRLLFIMTPRTGCTAIGDMLCERLGGRYLPEQDLLDDRGNIRIQKKHSSLKQLLDSDLLNRGEVASLVKCAAVRNPFDSLASLYVKKSTRSEELLSDSDSFVHRMPKYRDDLIYCAAHSFDEWIAHRFGISMARRLFWRGRRSLFDQYTTGVDVILRFESLQDDFNAVLRRVGAQPLSIPRVNATSARDCDYRKYYSPESRSIVEYAFAGDLEKYGYSF